MKTIYTNIEVPLFGFCCKIRLRLKYFCGMFHNIIRIIIRTFSRNIYKISIVFTGGFYFKGGSIGTSFL